MTNLLKRFMQDTTGATAVEYGILAALISVALVAGAKPVGAEVKSTFCRVAHGMVGKL